MKVEAETNVAVITDNSTLSRGLYMDSLGLPLKQLDGEYFATSELEGCGHFGVWPLAQAAQACFGAESWPRDLVHPQMSIEFELADQRAVAEAAAELRSDGYDLLHDAKTEPWGQTVSRLLSPEGVIVGLSFAPPLHGGDQPRD